MTKLACDIFKTYCGKIQWSKIVQSIKTDKLLVEPIPTNEKNTVIDYSKIGEIRIHKADIEKYTKYLTDNK